jgi:hypothetical protein
VLLLEIGFGGFGRGAGLTNWKKEGGKVRPWVGGKEDWVRRGREGALVNFRRERVTPTKL